MTKTNYYLAVLCIAFVFLKLISISTTNFNLYGDEAQYWLWSKDLSFGYYSKPPLLAWIIGFVTYFFGNSFLIIKSIPVLLYCISSCLVFFFVKKLYNNKSLAINCSLAFFLLPAVSVSSFLVSTDIVLILFWILGLIQLLRIKESPTNMNFIFFGIVLGLMFLSKYAAIYFIISLFFLFFFDQSYKFIWIKYKFKLLLSLLFLFIVFFPNLFWNYNNGWLTIQHTSDNASLNKMSLNFFGLFNFLISQIVMIGPILAVVFVFYFIKKFPLEKKDYILICFAIPTLSIVLIESLLVRAHANWAAVSLVTILVFFVKIIEKANIKIIYFNNYFNLIVGIIFFLMVAFNSPLKFFNRINGMHEFANYINNINQKNIDNFVVGDRLLFSNLNYEYKTKNINFYSPHQPGNRVVHHFQFKNPLPEDFSKNFILIGSLNDISYLTKINKEKLIGSRSFTFNKQNVKIYEITFN